MHDQEGLTAAERAPLDRLLARLLLAEPDAALLELLRTGPLGLEVVDEEAAREDYARLFLLPGGAPPFASAWLEGERERLGAQLSSFVHAMLEALGRELKPVAPWGNLPLDHLGVLLDLSAEAHCSPDPADHELGERILIRAVHPWVARFASALELKAHTPVYRAAGRLLAQLHGGNA